MTLVDYYLESIDRDNRERKLNESIKKAIDEEKREVEKRKLKK